MASFNSAAGQSSGGGKQRATESPVQSKKETAETQQQRQAAAKLALRKQLEKTLLQVGIYTMITPKTAIVQLFSLSWDRLCVVR